MYKPNNYIAFIEQIIEMTKNNSLTWDYLDSHTKLYQGMKWTQSRTQFDVFLGSKEVERPNFDDENSFYTKIDNTYIVLYARDKSPANLYVVPYTYKNVVIMTADMYGEYITRLMNIVQSKFPSAKSFIDSFLNKNQK